VTGDQANTAEATVLLTGAAGFIGFHLARRLLEHGRSVLGLDNLNAYYDVALKQSRLAELRRFDRFSFIQADVADRPAVDEAFARSQPKLVLHMAAQAGVRYALENPDAYVSSNLSGFHNVIDAARAANVAHFVYASSSSVYGANTVQPFQASRPADHPVSLYAATKRSNELVAHCYSHLHGLPATGLRFFTVYGPWGRPDMALFRFTRAILEGRPIELYNEGRMRRDFTYIDDVVTATLALAKRPPAPHPPTPGRDPPLDGGFAPCAIYNIGRSKPEELTQVVAVLERALGRKAQVVLAPMQPGDVAETFADTTPLSQFTGFEPKVDIETGIARFVDWYTRHYDRASGHHS
jgi:UDP-glucuronate 4-epimerase